MTNKMDEQILAILTNELFKGTEKFQGVASDEETVDTMIGNLESQVFIARRGDLEEDPDCKQPIPYALIRRGDEVFIYERLAGGGESRLHSALSIGVGGHMNNLSNTSFSDDLYLNLNREVEEELNVDEGQFDVSVLGILNDDSDEVGQVHVCLLTEIKISEAQNVTVRETDQLDGKWITIEDLKKPETFDRLENWSKIVVEELL